MTYDDIKSARLSRGLTQKELAEKINVTESLIRKYENESVIPPLGKIKLIAEALNMNFVYGNKGIKLIDEKSIKSTMNDLDLARYILDGISLSIKSACYMVECKHTTNRDPLLLGGCKCILSYDVIERLEQLIPQYKQAFDNFRKVFEENTNYTAVMNDETV